jgi:cytosine deaminase
MTAAFSIARARRYLLCDARVLPNQSSAATQAANREGLLTLDILIDEGRIAALGPALAARAPDTPRLSLDRRIVLPLFVDAHTHIDKGHIWPRAPNPNGDFDSALITVADDRSRRWSAGDVARRMEFSLRSAYARGTGVMRTHIDSVGEQTSVSWPVFAEVRERWRGRIALQGAPLFAIDLALDSAHMGNLEAMVAAHGTNIVGAATFMSPGLREGLTALFSLAERRGWDLDFHVDESADPEARSLGVIAEMAIARRFAGKILIGHCCSLARQGADEAQRTIERVARARIGVVSLPMCNLFLMDRHAGRTPRWRGVTALHELRAAGVDVMIASDNTRDPFYAYGDLDMMEVWREGVRILHLDYPHADWASAVFDAPAKALGVEAGRIEVGASADLILTSARTFTELFARPQGDRVVLRGGRALEDAPPPYWELDDLEGLSP